MKENTIDSPYQSPQHYGRPKVVPLEVTPYSGWNSTVIFFRWLTVCILAAAPSFVLGVLFDGANSEAIFGMVCGVLCYVAAYTSLEHVPQIRKLLAQRPARRTAQIGYGTRIGISVLFPIGFYLDMLVGIASVPASLWILRLAGQENSLNSPENKGGFLSHFVMTVVQGACLNIVLLVYMLVVYTIVRAVMGKSSD